MRSQSIRLFTLALGMLLGVALTLAVPALAQDAPPLDLAACAAALAQQSSQNGGAQTISGPGRQQSAPFHLDGGAYRVDWTYAKPVAIGTSIMLEAADAATAPSYGMIVNGDPIGATSGQTFAYKLKPGEYFISAQVAAPWTVTLTPVAP